MTAATIITHAELSALTGYRTGAAIERWCKARGIPVMRSKAGIWTTHEAINQALGVATIAPPPNTPVRF